MSASESSGGSGGGRVGWQNYKKIANGCCGSSIVATQVAIELTQARDNCFSSRVVVYRDVEFHGCELSTSKGREKAKKL